jgi:hypothetical protein
VPLHPSGLEAAANGAHNLNAPLVLTLVFAAALAQPQTLVVDLDADHHLDTVVLTQTQKQIEVTVTYGDPQYPTETFRFPVNSGLQDAVCAVPVVLKREKAHGFIISDGKCDSLHFFFNHKTNKIQYWRL